MDSSSVRCSLLYFTKREADVACQKLLWSCDAHTSLVCS